MIARRQRIANSRTSWVQSQACMHEKLISLGIGNDRSEDCMGSFCEWGEWRGRWNSAMVEPSARTTVVLHCRLQICRVDR